MSSTPSSSDGSGTNVTDSVETKTTAFVSKLETKKTTPTSLEDQVHKKEEQRRRVAAVSSLSWAFREFFWLMKETFLLVFYMSYGVLWILRTVRMVVYTFIISGPVLRCIWFYMNANTLFRRVAYRSSNKEGETAADVGSKNNRAYLDLYFPVPTADLLRFRMRSEVPKAQLSYLPGAGDKTHQQREIEISTARQRAMVEEREQQQQQARANSSRHLRGGSNSSSPGASSCSDYFSQIPNTPPIFNPRRSAPSPQLSKPYPVMMVITGGAWIIGSHFWGIPIARLFADNDYLTVCPDYRNFPQATISEMVEDVTDAIAWVVNNIDQFGGDPDHITLLGQSAGAHMTFLSLVSQAELLAAGKTPKYDPRLIKRVVGLSGIYNLDKLRPHLHARGLHSKAQEMMFENNLKYWSPTLRLADLPLDTFDHFFPMSIVLIHGVKDNSAPWQEADTLAAVLQKKCAKANAARAVQLSSSTNTNGGQNGEAAGELNGSLGPNNTNNKITRACQLYLMPDATHTTPYVDDPVMQKSQVVEIMCTLDNNPEPRLGVRPPLSSQWVLNVANIFMAF